MTTGKTSVPNHVAIIMDGNGRWAAAKGKTRTQGHKEGGKNLKCLIESFLKYGISYVTLFAFSTENWKRPKFEINNLFSLLASSLNNELESIHKSGIKLIFLGERFNLPKTLQKRMSQSEMKTKHNNKGTVCIALNYGSRMEIVNATKKMVDTYNNPSEINAKLVTENLYTFGIPDVDLLIRTGGEKRISNFLLWQSVDAKFISSETLWPDFKTKHIDAIMKTYKDL